MLDQPETILVAWLMQTSNFPSRAAINPAARMTPQSVSEIRRVSLKQSISLHKRSERLSCNAPSSTTNLVASMIGPIFSRRRCFLGCLLQGPLPCQHLLGTVTIHVGIVHCQQTEQLILLDGLHDWKPPPKQAQIPQLVPSRNEALEHLKGQIRLCPTIA